MNGNGVFDGIECPLAFDGSQQRLIGLRQGNGPNPGHDSPLRLKLWASGTVPNVAFEIRSFHRETILVWREVPGRRSLGVPRG
jgi:hypothetical protein